MNPIAVRMVEVLTPKNITLPIVFLSFGLAASASEKSSWKENLTAIPEASWDADSAAHLLERAGFGGTPEDIEVLSRLKPREAVMTLFGFGTGNNDKKPFVHSGIFEDGIDPFPSSRPATTELAQKNGEALGIKVNGSRRPMQAVVNQFFYWIRASRLETDRVAYWWAEKMLNSRTPVEDKMALFWHGHFAVNEDKVRDYRKMHQQLLLFYRLGLGSFRDLLIGVAQDPAMLAFLDAGVNVKGAPNENFAREIMELFTMGPGNYTELDIRDGARAFTGWNFKSLGFEIDLEKHDAGKKTFLGRVGTFDGIDIIDIILGQDITAEFLASKIYRFFVREEVSDRLRVELGNVFRAMNYEIKPFVQKLLLSKDFYAEETRGGRIKSPVEFVLSTYKKLGLQKLPGSPDFNLVTGSLGQRLMHPPTVAGWSYGKSWITPSLLMERGNFVLDLMFPDIEFIPQDKYPVYPSGEEIISVHRRLREGFDIAMASQPTDVDLSENMVAMSNDMSGQEDFNTRYGSYRGWQKAIERVKPIPRHLGKINLSSIVRKRGLETPIAVIDYFAERFLSVELEENYMIELASFLASELGTENINSAVTYMEDALRLVLHMILSTAEYQLG